MRLVNQIVIHCAATPNGDARFHIAELDRMHRERGFRKIGYHFVIEIDGAMKIGRDIEEIGAHVEGNNARSIGICMIGTDRFTVDQWAMLRELIKVLKVKYPWASIVGHRDFSPDRNGDGLIESWEWIKVCPGFDVKEWLLSGMDPIWNPNHLISVNA